MKLVEEEEEAEGRMSAEGEKNVHSFEVKKIERGRKFLKELGIERTRVRRLEVNSDEGSIRISSVRNEEKQIQYSVADIKSLERMKVASCVRLVTTGGKEFNFKFASKAGMEMFCDLLYSIREEIAPMQANFYNRTIEQILESPSRSRGYTSARSNSPDPIEGEEKEPVSDSDVFRTMTSPNGSNKVGIGGSLNSMINGATNPSKNSNDSIQSRPENCSIYCTTFNMGNAKPPSVATMKMWIPSVYRRSDNGPDEPMHDIYAISVQERSYDVENGTAREHWRDCLSAIFPAELYTCLSHIDSWDRSLTIYVRNDIECRIQMAEADTVNVGVGGMAGNKGAIGVKFSLYDTVFCFVNSHLAAHQYEIAKRNADFSEIVRTLKLRDSATTDLATSAFHHVFWMGDLNYRISLDRNLCIDLIEANQWNDLNSMDQLTGEKASGRVFCGFQEGKLMHPPTYKLVRGDVFDDEGRRLYSEEKSRVPAWTDRILYKSLQGSSVHLIKYGSLDCITTSDHSPVFAMFECGLTHTSGLRSVKTMLRIAHLEDPFYVHFREIRARPLRPEEPIASGEYSLLFDPKILVDDKPVRSEPRRDVIFPVWSKPDLPVLCTIENKPELLAKKHLQVTLRCKDTGGKASKKQDFFASTIVWLGAAADENGEIVFNEALLRNGVKVGTLEGSLRISQERYLD